ncbi:hypothetical protein AVEN_153560-1 [Araneus ventricosus]|uniref:Uncharacterized protein n=1 Tax=Araneus ventricosus TaxID=182803 RepID=A0A4Y2WJZ1_ARAVE|nr:hypothetical protein AVEN_153560-1 [Araneus ventricosus]
MSDISVQTDVEKFQRSDISVQTDVGEFQMTKDAETITDKFVCGDNERVELKTANSAPPILGDYKGEIKGSNSSYTDITFDRIPLLLYQGENEETPEIDPEFEVDEPEVIEIFQNSKNSFSLFDNPTSESSRISRKTAAPEFLLLSDSDISAAPGISISYLSSWRLQKFHRVSAILAAPDFSSRSCYRGGSCRFHLVPVISAAPEVPSRSCHLEGFKCFHLVSAILAAPDFSSRSCHRGGSCRFYLVLVISAAPGISISYLSPWRFQTFHLVPVIAVAPVVSISFLPFRRLQKFHPAPVISKASSVSISYLPSWRLKTSSRSCRFYLVSVILGGSRHFHLISVTSAAPDLSSRVCHHGSPSLSISSLISAALNNTILRYDFSFMLLKIIDFLYNSQNL